MRLCYSVYYLIIKYTEVSNERPSKILNTSNITPVISVSTFHPFIGSTMKIPSEVVWQLTKKWNSKLVKFNGQQFSHDPFSLSNLHNASQANSTVGLSAKKVQGKKGKIVAKRVVSLIQKNKSSSRKSAASSKVELRRGINSVGRVVKGLNISQGSKKLALKRAQRLIASTRPHVKSAKKDEKK